MKKVKSLFGILLAAALLIAAPVFAGEESATSGFGFIGAGDQMPEIVLKNLGGESRDIGLNPDGGPFSIYFWSVFCSNCKEAVPHLVKLHEEWEERGGLKVWAVNVDGERFSNAVESYVNDSGFPFEMVYDQLVGEMLLAADPMGVERTPTLFILDKESKVILRQDSYVDIEKVKEALAGQN